MPRPTREECGWELKRAWLNALEETARDFYDRPKEFCTRAYEHATKHWLRIMEDEYGLTFENAGSIKEAVENYIKLGVESGLFKDASQFVIEEINPDLVKVKVISCPYQESCQDIINDGFGLKDLTCPRIGCFRAAVALKTNVDCDYQVNTTSFEEGCEGFIERK